MLSEIETLEKGNGRIEEEILVLYDRIDERKVSLKSHEKDFEQYRASTRRNGKKSMRSLRPSMGNWRLKRKNTKPWSRV